MIIRGPWTKGSHQRAACVFGIMIAMMVKVFIPQMIVHPAVNQWIRLEMKYPLPHTPDFLSVSIDRHRLRQMPNYALLYATLPLVRREAQCD